MANINRVTSPMNLYEEDLLKTREELDLIKSDLLRKQNESPAFLIGSIDRVNEKIAHLDQQLQSYTELVIESRASNFDDDYGTAMDVQPPYREKGYQKEKEIRELNQFAGLYSIKATLLPQVNTKVKQLTKIPLPASRKTQQSKEMSAIKPKLVELYQYPGFEPTDLTPLPDVDALTILKKIASAKKDLDRKPFYKAEFKRLFYSRMSEAILVDTYWWIFLQHYHPSKKSQSKLFNRIAHNYVKLLLYAKEPQYRDVFFKNYPDLLSQAIYSSFCEAFPTSWRQFDDNFRSDICTVTSQWIDGTNPVPRSWMAWNYKAIEPQGMRKAEVITNKSKKGNLLDFDFISAESSRTSNSTSVLSDGSPSSSVALSNKYGRSYQKRRNSKDGRGYYESSTSGSQQSESDLGSAELQKQVSPQGMRARHRHRIVKPQMSANKVEDNGKMRVDALTPITENLHSEGDIEEMSLYIRRLPKGARGSTCGPQPPPKTSLPMDTYTRNRNKSHKYQSPHRSPDGSSNNSLTKSPRHITRFESPSGKELNKSSKSGGALTQQSYASMTHATSISAMRQLSDGAKKRESHPACKGPDFIKTMFNVHSQSPLVAHFLNQKGLRYDVGTNVVVQRTEVRNLPPLEAPTYRDIISDAFRSVRMLEDQYQRMYEEGSRASRKFIKDQKLQEREHYRRENALLAKNREIKRLSDLLVLELLKDADEMTTGAAQAVENALMEQD